MPPPPPGQAAPWYRRAWIRYRSWPLWAQIVTGVFAFFMIVGALTPKEEDGTEVASRSATTTTEATTTTAPTTTTTTLPPGVPAVGDDTTVASITDGDTFRVANGESAIRLIGVDTPETGTCFAAEATAHLNTLIPPGTRVRLSYDVERLDRFQRTLAYVYRLTDGLFVNAAMVRDGFAMQLTIAPNVAKAEEIGAVVADARSARRGLWGSCPTTTLAPATTLPPTTSAPATTRPTSPPVTAPPATAAPAGCHSSYAGACVPIASDVDCGGGSGNGPAYVYDKNFQVVGPDVYGLDSDNDGIGCESR